MIKTQNLVPEVYYNKSRDFQALGRTFDVVFNYLKTGSDIIYSRLINETSDDKLVELLSLTLGFKSKHHYTNRQLVALCSAFAYMLRNKGSLRSIEAAIAILINSEGVQAKPTIVVNDDYTELTIYIPVEVKDINLFNDLLTYILPAGMGCNVIRQSTVDAGQSFNDFSSEDRIGWGWLTSSDKMSDVPQYVSGGRKVAEYDNTIGNAVVVPYVPEEDRDSETRLLPKDTGEGD